MRRIAYNRGIIRTPPPHAPDRDDLPKGNIPILKTDGNYHEDNIPERSHSNSDILQAYVYSKFASDSSHRRSVSGYHVKLAGGVWHRAQLKPNLLLQLKQVNISFLCEQ